MALLLGLSSCVSQQQKCPDDEELLKAGFRIYSASEMINSDKDLDHRLAKTNFCMANDFYFICNGDDYHKEGHYQEAMDKASKYLGFSETDKKRFERNVRRIRDEVRLTSLAKK